MQDDQNGNGEEGPRKQHKQKCWHCGLYDCRGKRRGGKCTNPCQDCDMSARGRTVVLGEIVERGGNYVQGCQSQHKRKKINMHNVLTCFLYVHYSNSCTTRNPAVVSTRLGSPKHDYLKPLTMKNHDSSSPNQYWEWFNLLVTCFLRCSEGVAATWWLFRKKEVLLSGHWHVSLSRHDESSYLCQRLYKEFIWYKYKIFLTRNLV